MDAKDIIFKDDLIIVNGDFSVGLSDDQHIQHIIQADTGQFRQWPLQGVGINKQVGANKSDQALKQKTRLKLKSDNYSNVLVKFVSDKGVKNLTVEATRLK